MRQDISVEDARTHVAGQSRRLSSEQVSLADALGRVLARPIVASAPSPPFDASAMDGVAVRVGDLTETPMTLPIVGSSWAGAPFEGVLPPRAAVQIATGAVVPEGADAIVPVEWTRGIGETVTIERRPETGHAIRSRGSAVTEGEAVARPGTRITPSVVSALATIGAVAVPVIRQPRVRIVITGDEVVPPGRPLAPGQIHDANGATLAAQVRLAGGLPEVLYVGDEEGALQSVIHGEPDLLLVSGGVSVGDRDRVRGELGEVGVEWHFWRVRQRPGKPLLFGTRGGVPVLGLPGNPVSAAVCFEVYARPLLVAMGGGEVAPRRERARLVERIPKPTGLHTFARVNGTRAPDGVLELTSTGNQASHAILSLSGDGLAHLPAAWSEAPPGAEVDFEPFAWSPPPCSSGPSA